MWKDLVRAAVLAILGAGLFFIGQTFAAAALILISLGSGAAAWWFRTALPLDPLLEAAIAEASQLRKTNPAAAAHILERGFAAAAALEERQLAELRATAARDHRAARDLRNRLRAQLKGTARARRRIERVLRHAPGRATVLAELDRRSAVTAQRLAEAEQCLHRLPT